MKKTILYILVLSYFSVAADFSDRTILIGLHQQEPALTIQNKNILSSNSKINSLISKYNIVRVEKWLRSADETDVINGVDLSKIYRLHFKQPQEIQSMQKVLADFKNLPEIQSAQQEPLVKIASPVEPYIPDDPYFNRQWYLHKIQADYAWALWRDSLPGDPQILIGIVDTGLDYLHPDLQDAVYINPGEDIDGDGLFTTADLNSVDDDSNGFVDDVRGWDFAGDNYDAQQDNDIRPPFAGNYQILSHGTHVAGIAGAITDNKIGVAGVSFRSKIIATKQSFDDDVENGYLWNAYDGILYCAKMGAAVINCSWGSSYGDPAGQAVIDDAVNNYGATIVCASGNDNTNNDIHHFYPSDYENVITVAALNSSDKKAYFSNYGNVIDISAPGVGILSTIHANAGSYKSWAGTSMASPVVAGAFALLKSWFPQQNREWLIEALLQGADPLDEINPAYAGKLGAGRVNVFNPIARRIFPNIKIEDYSFTILNDNSDGQLNPGERAKIHLNLSNRENWQDAIDLKIVLSTTEDNVVFEDSLAEWGYLSAGDSLANDGDDLIIEVSAGALYGPLEITANFQANMESGNPYQDSQKLLFHVTQNQKGFPISTIEVNQPLTVFRAAKDDSGELAVIGSDNHLHVFSCDGKTKNGFPKDLNSFTGMPPAIADMDGDGLQDIVIMNRYGLLQVFNGNGQTILKKDFDETVYGNLSLADVDADGIPEIIFGSMRKKVHIFKMDSSEIDSFPMAFPSLIDKGIAIADVDDDKRPELIFGTFDRRLHLLQCSGHEMDGWPVELPSRIIFTPIITTKNDIFAIAVTTLDKKLFIFNENAEKTLELTLDARVSSAPAFADLSGDGSAEIVFFTLDAVLHVLDLDGKELNPFPLQLEEVVRSSPVFYDFDGDQRPEIVLTSETGRIFIIKYNVENLANFPARLDGNLNASPVIADLDGDGDVEIISAGSEGIFALDLGSDFSGQNLWQTWLGNNQRTGFYSQEATGLPADEPAILIFRPELEQNYPNPFNPQTTISCQLAVGGEVELAVYNLLGQKIKNLFSGRIPKGRYNFVWDGRNEFQQEVGSGIYFYRLKGKGFAISRRMLLLR